eukprot:379174-Pelagomonas_calceolata.AAC.4
MSAAAIMRSSSSSRKNSRAIELSVMGKFYHTRVTRRWDNANAMEAIDWDKQHIRILGLYYKTWKGKGNKKGALFRTPLYHHEFDAASYNEDVEEEDCCDDEDGGSAEETSAQQQNTLSEGKRCLVADYPSTEEYVAALEVLQERNPKRVRPAALATSSPKPLTPQSCLTILLGHSSKVSEHGVH